MKLGRLLTQSDLITEKQLEDALNAQLIHGGHLGTCLIEREYITEEQLGQVLADAFNIGCAKKEVFDSVSRFVVGLMPTEMVEKHQAVPFRLVEDTLDVAMIDPKDLRAIDELAFASGRNIRAWIAPEIRILQAMDRYYGITRRMRYVTLSRQLDQAAIEHTGGGGGEIIYEPSSCAAQAVIAAVPISDTVEPDGSPADAAASWGAGPRSAVATLQAPAATATESAVVTAPKADELLELSGLLVRVAGEKKLGELAVEFASGTFARTMLFTVEGESARPWTWDGFELSSGRAAELSFPITSEPIFALVKGENQYRGPLPDSGRCDGFYDALQAGAPREVLLVPAYSDDRLVAMLYGDDGGEGGLPSDLSVFRRLMTKVGLALDLIRIKQRIRSS